MYLTKFRRHFWSRVPSRLLDSPFSFLGKNGQAHTHLELGVIGEAMAAHYLRRLGGKVLYANYRGPKGGEIDIVLRDHDTLAFVEVKTRKRREESRPLDAVNIAKQTLIHRGACAWLRLLPENEFLWRFDVVEVVLEDGVLPEINWIKAAFVT